jgi:hypothetical protein
LDAATTTLFAVLWRRQIEPSRSEVAQQLNHFRIKSEQLAKMLRENGVLARRLRALKLAYTDLHSTTRLALEDAAAGADHLDAGKSRLDETWTTVLALDAADLEPEAAASASKALQLLHSWAQAAAEARPRPPAAHETTQAIVRRAALLILEIIERQTGEAPTLSRYPENSPEKAGKPGGRWLRLLIAVFAHIRRKTLLYPETRAHAADPVLAPPDETLAEWLRAARDMPHRFHLGIKSRPMMSGRQRRALEKKRSLCTGQDRT